MKEKYGNGLDHETSNNEVRESVLRVVNKPYKSTYTNGINIQGEYLKKYGFCLGDTVKVIVTDNQINISKIINQDENEA